MLMTPLFEKHKKDKFYSQEEEIKTLESVKKEIVNAKKLLIPDQTKLFILFTAASQTIIGGVLCQTKKDEMWANTWISRRFESGEINYSIREREYLAIVWCIKKLRIYLQNEFIIYTDHRSLEWL
ncbi:hypothetical protein, LTR Retrotransposon [Trachipleistophora hominis]|uniref:Reverse transcriptase/retrotransposon-derived protein RNase H-like domain-containing protein n=1 Tax=Trachipleistophora hominis TaxID=72359 RepID=L7JZ91_TRAHO|nr:hypothetical protein, LTR Retrotransposon [Trachipleistophora hominis]